LGYNRFYKQLNDAVIDDSGYVHIVVEAVYADTFRTYTYYQYTPNSAMYIKKEIYHGTYYTNYNRNLHARILILKDWSVLILYPDDMFYLCWTLLDRHGEVLDQRKYENLRGLANFRVCGTTLDSIHIVSWLYHYWADLLERYDPNIGKYYIEIDPSILPSLFYTNKHILAFDSVQLYGQYRNMNTPYMFMINDTTVFCFFDTPKAGYTGIIDQYGSFSEGAKFIKDNLDSICFSKIDIVDVLTEYRVPKLSTTINHQWVGLAKLSEETVGVGLYSKGSLYLLKFDSGVDLLHSQRGSNERCDIAQMVSDPTYTFITQIFSSGVHGNHLTKTIYYWGFNSKGDFFVQIY
jgi:hypothetical protein